MCNFALTVCGILATVTGISDVLTDAQTVCSHTLTCAAFCLRTIVVLGGESQREILHSDSLGLGFAARNPPQW